MGSERNDNGKCGDGNFPDERDERFYTSDPVGALVSDGERWNQLKYFSTRSRHFCERIIISSRVHNVWRKGSSRSGCGNYKFTILRDSTDLALLTHDCGRIEGGRFIEYTASFWEHIRIKLSGYATSIRNRYLKPRD